MVFIALICSCYLANPAIDLTKYELLREDEVRDNEWVNFRYVLVFRPSDLRIPLGKRMIANVPKGYDDNVGLNEETLSVSWIVQDRIIYIHWTSWPMGNGINTVTTHILVDVSTGKPIELLRESYLKYSRASNIGTTSQDVVITFDEGKNEILVTVTLDELNHREFPSPLAERTDDGRYTQRYVIRQTTHHHLMEAAFNKFVWHNEVTLQLGERKVPAREVADLFVLLYAPRWRSFRGEGECSERERSEMLREMKKEASEICTGDLRCPITELILTPFPQGQEYP